MKPTTTPSINERCLVCNTPHPGGFYGTWLVGDDMRGTCSRKCETAYEKQRLDEAQAMPLETLEAMRLLTNLETEKRKLLQIVLFGQPELDSHLDSSDMRQLKERITHSFRLEPMVTDDIRSYIDFRMRAAGYKVVNVDSTIIAQQPRMAPHIQAMVGNIASDLGIDAEFANVKAKTTEKLGFVGRGEGIAAQAIALVDRVS